MVLGVSLLASLGVLSSGFAGWVIAADPISKEGNGSISADYTVVTNGVESVTEKGKDGEVRFAANGTTAGKNWLTADKGAADLEASFSYTVKLYDSSEAKTLSFSELTFAENGTNGYAKAVESGVVGTLPTFVSVAPSEKSTGYILITANGANVTLADSNKSASVTLQSEKSLDVTFSIHFAWGTEFGGENPLDYFNSLDKDSTNVKKAQDAIAKLKDADGANFKLSFKVGVTA